ncbi:hypothetical protein VP01_783g1 [Puccinia sorghi]|uniref:Uncharacterized protein n=1 Tax=Puccinia sorghi TaxID=27349 RepID=A0A0L6UD54_9BASI|nr:hypothetical protein VP01_783g1 [Puccinia sorghi]
MTKVVDNRLLTGGCTKVRRLEIISPVGTPLTSPQRGLPDHNTVPNNLNMQKGRVWMAAWLEHAACQMEAVKQVSLAVKDFAVQILWQLTVRRTVHSYPSFMNQGAFTSLCSSHPHLVVHHLLFLALVYRLISEYLPCLLPSSGGQRWLLWNRGRLNYYFHKRSSFIKNKIIIRHLTINNNKMKAYCIAVQERGFKDTSTPAHHYTLMTWLKFCKKLNFAPVITTLYFVFTCLSWPEQPVVDHHHFYNCYTRKLIKLVRNWKAQSIFYWNHNLIFENRHYLKTRTNLKSNTQFMNPLQVGQVGSFQNHFQLPLPPPISFHHSQHSSTQPLEPCHLLPKSNYSKVSLILEEMLPLNCNNLLNCIKLTCSMLQLSCYLNPTCLHNLVESLLEKCLKLLPDLVDLKPFIVVHTQCPGARDGCMYGICLEPIFEPTIESPGESCHNLLLNLITTLSFQWRQTSFIGHKLPFQLRCVSHAHTHKRKKKNLEPEEFWYGRANTDCQKSSLGPCMCKLSQLIATIVGLVGWRPEGLGWRVKQLSFSSRASFNHQVFVPVGNTHATPIIGSFFHAWCMHEKDRRKKESWKLEGH